MKESTDVFRAPQIDFLLDFSYCTLSTKEDFILVLEPKEVREGWGPDLAKWAVGHREKFEDLISQYGGILFRNFRITSAEFKSFASSLYPKKIMSDYSGGYALREKIDDEGLFLATTAPKGVVIRQHHEMAYLRNFPSKCLFFCDVPANMGGETPLTSNRTFTRRINGDCLKKFKEKEVMYRRNFFKEYVPGYGVGWSRSYQTEIKKDVEEFLKRNGAAFEWKANDILCTSNIAQGVTRHPVTEEELWFNCAYIGCRSSGVPGMLAPCYEKAMRGVMSADYLTRMRSLPVDQLPSNSFYGDGACIEASVLAEIDAIYEEEQLAFKWQKGDFLIIDNVLVSHGRNPFEGENRRILVIMVD